MKRAQPSSPRIVDALGVDRTDLVAVAVKEGIIPAPGDWGALLMRAPKGWFQAHEAGPETDKIKITPAARQGRHERGRPARVFQLPVLLQAPVRPPYDPRAHGADCDACPLKGQQVVPPTLPETEVCAAIVVGQEPGFAELRANESFVGPSGKKVNKALARYGIDRKSLHITNAALCLPSKDEDRPFSVKCCAQRLRNEIDSYPKSVPVVPLGAFAFQSVYGRKLPMTIVRGFLWEKDERDILPTLHPAFVLRDDLQQPLFSRDWKRIATRIHEGRLELCAPKSFSVPRRLDELKRILAKFTGPLIACDIETTEEPPTICTLQCIGLSDGKITTVVPWKKEYRAVLAKFFAVKVVTGHNFFAFDSIVLSRYGMECPQIEDTLIAHHVFASHMPQRMDHVVSFYLDSEAWKVQFGKRGGSEKGVPKTKTTEDEGQLFVYNSKDAWKQWYIWEAMQGDLASWQTLYAEDKEQAELCRSMQVTGALVDKKRKDDLSKAISEKEVRVYDVMKGLAGRDFNPKNPADIREILYTQFGAPVLERTKKRGLPATGKKILQALATASGNRPYSAFCKHLITLRSCMKLRVTYLDNLPVEADGRVHASWRSFGTPTGRYACRRPNLMNLKRRENDEPEQQIRDIYIAAPGYVLLSFDMEQVEPRVAAYISGDPNMIAAVESGDFHTANARILFKNDDGTDLPELMDLKEAKHGKGKNKRDVAKSSGLAVNYMAGADKLYESIREKGHEVKYPTVVAMIERLHRAYQVHYAFVDKNVEFCRKNGYVVAGFRSGRIRWLGHAPSPSDIANTPIQSGAADAMNDRLPKIWRHLPKGVKLIAQIHDAGIFEVPIKLVDRVKAIIREVMSVPFVINGRSIVLPIEIKQGHRWSEI